MIRAWEWTKENRGYVYCLIFVVFAVIDALQGSEIGFAIDASLAVIMVLAHQHPSSPLFVGRRRVKATALAPPTPLADAVSKTYVDLLKAGSEPIPIPGEGVAHRDACQSCKETRDAM